MELLLVSFLSSAATNWPKKANKEWPRILLTVRVCCYDALRP